MYMKSLYLKNGISMRLFEQAFACQGYICLSDLQMLCFPIICTSSSVSKYESSGSSIDKMSWYKIPVHFRWEFLTRKYFRRRLYFSNQLVHWRGRKQKGLKVVLAWGCFVNWSDANFFYSFRNEKWILTYLTYRDEPLPTISKE